MKKYTYIYFFIFLLAGQVSHAQSYLPVFSQRLTVSPIYNPALTGQSGGSGYLVYRNNLTRVTGALSTAFAGGHIPFWEGRSGVGLNVFQDNFNLAKNLFITPSYAYHLKFNSTTSLSMGLAGEFSNMRFDPANVNFDYTGDQLAEQVFADPVNVLDFSVGINFSSRFFAAGGSANRMSNIFGIRENEDLANEFYMFYGNGFIPMRGGIDMIEPVVTVRYLPSNQDNFIPQLDVGAYYTYNNLFTAGVNYGLTNSDLGAYVEGTYQGFALGFAYSNVGKAISGRPLGSNFEVNLRFDFMQENYQLKLAGANSRVNIRAVSAQRKALGSATVRPRTFKNTSSSRPKVKSYKRRAAKIKKRSSRGRSFSKFAKTGQSRYTRKQQTQRRKYNQRQLKRQRNRPTQYRRPGTFWYKVLGPKKRR